MGRLVRPAFWDEEDIAFLERGLVDGGLPEVGPFLEVGPEGICLRWGLAEAGEEGESLTSNWARNHPSSAG